LTLRYSQVNSVGTYTVTLSFAALVPPTFKVVASPGYDYVKFTMQDFIMSSYMPNNCNIGDNAKVDILDGSVVVSTLVAGGSASAGAAVNFNNEQGLYLGGLNNRTLTVRYSQCNSVSGYSVSQTFAAPVPPTFKAAASPGYDYVKFTMQDFIATSYMPSDNNLKAKVEVLDGGTVVSSLVSSVSSVVNFNVEQGMYCGGLGGKALTLRYSQVNSVGTYTTSMTFAAPVPPTFKAVVSPDYMTVLFTMQDFRVTSYMPNNCNLTARVDLMDGGIVVATLASSVGAVIDFNSEQRFDVWGYGGRMMVLRYTQCSSVGSYTTSVSFGVGADGCCVFGDLGLLDKGLCVGVCGEVDRVWVMLGLIDAGLCGDIRAELCSVLGAFLTDADIAASGIC